MLSERDTAPLHSARDDRPRAARGIGKGQCCLQRCNVMTVEIYRLEAERHPLVDDRLQLPDVCDPTVGLQPIEIDDDREVLQVVVSRRERSLPDGTLVNLAITDDDEDVVGGSADACRICHPDPDGEPMAERGG